MKYRRLLRIWANAAAISLCMTSAWSQTHSRSFDVRITLNTQGTQGICIHQLRSQAANAIVKVVCGSEQFVSIEAIPNRPFLGTQGGAHRFSFGSLSSIPSGLTSGSDVYGGSGTVTSLQVINLNYLDSPLEMLVSF